MADLYLKRLEAERKTLWATCRLKGLAKDTPERQRIAEIDRLIAEHKGKGVGKSPSPPASQLSKPCCDDEGDLPASDLTNQFKRIH